MSPDKIGSVDTPFVKYEQIKSRVEVESVKKNLANCAWNWYRFSFVSFTISATNLKTTKAELVTKEAEKRTQSKGG